MLNKFSFIFILSICLSCGKGPSTLKASSPIECTTPTCDSTFTVKTQKVESIINHRQILPNYQKCLGVAASATTKTAYKEVVNTFSLNGDVKDVSAPMLMALTKVTSELCNDLIAAEKNLSTRKFFPGFTLTGGTNTQTFNIRNSVESFANACWGTSISPEEVDLVIKDLGVKKDNSTALFICTALLTSANAIRF